MEKTGYVMCETERQLLCGKEIPVVCGKERHVL